MNPAFNYPNLLTFGRIVLTMFFVYLLILGGPRAKFLACVVFFLAGLSDYLDGMLARRHKTITSLGKIMDPIADKILILSSFYIFHEVYHLMSGWVFSLVAFREILITSMRMYWLKRGVVLPAEKTGKIKTISQMVYVLYVLLGLLITEWTPRFDVRLHLAHDLMLIWVVFITLYSALSYRQLFTFRKASNS